MLFSKTKNKVLDISLDKSLNFKYWKLLKTRIYLSLRLNISVLQML